MPFSNVKKWIESSIYPKWLSDTEKRTMLYLFWEEFYIYAKGHVGNPYVEKTANKRYKEGVIALLTEFSKLHRGEENRVVADPDELYNLQLKIENMTMHFDEESLFHSTTNILNIIIDPEKECARDFLRTTLTSEEDLFLIAEFGQYTLEALMVHVLCVLFSSADSMVRVASLVEQLEGHTRTQAQILRRRRFKAKRVAESPGQSQDSGKKKRLAKMFPIGTALVEFMEQRGLIRLATGNSGSTRVMKKDQSYYLPKALYVVCNFDISLLPIKLSLPMVCPPIEWKIANENAGSLSDLTGGYLSNPTSEMYDRYRLLSTTNQHNFYLELRNPAKLCEIMNCLQSQSFQINTDWLIYLVKLHNLFSDKGLLAPGFVSYINIMDVSGKLRELYMTNEYMKENFTYNELLLTLQKDIQRARHEKMILDLAYAYEGFEFYLPAFLDFRGRIYRCGVLHFHERDLSRSLIQFAKSQDIEPRVAVAATSFQFQSFNSDREAIRWYKAITNELVSEKGVSLHYSNEDSESNKQLIKLAANAKHPFQFLSCYLSVIYNHFESARRMPITQDASASAFQIMSYFLLDEKMARNTNLIQSPDGEIQDIYLSILCELKSYIEKKAEDSNLSSTLIKVLDRKLVKGVFMPIIYGKTMMSTVQDVKENLSKFLTPKECFTVAKICFDFWKDRFHHLECLIRLIRSIGWITSSSGRPVQYEVDNFRTIQDYVKMDAINIWVYDRLLKKRRQVTMRVASDKRDSRKTEISTFVNFIHQKDAYIAMKVVEVMLELKAPIYTVHDNFITTSYYSPKIASFYSSAIKSLGHPLKIINQFIYLNVIKHVYNHTNITLNDCLIEQMIPKDSLMYLLEEKIPEEIKRSKTKRKVWDDKIKTIVNSYEAYTRHVCGPYEDPMDGRSFPHEKDEHFIEMMKRNPEIPLNSVHY